MGRILRTILPDRKFEIVLDKALAEKPADRYQSAAEMDLDLARCLDGVPIRAKVRRTRLVSALCVVIAAVGLFAFVRTRAMKPQEAEAHELVIKAGYELQHMTVDSLQRAEDDYRRAVAIDPKDAEAYLGLAAVEMDRASTKGVVEAEAERKSERAFLEKAIALDPGSPTGHARLGTLVMQYDWDWQRAENEFKAAVAGYPNGTAESSYAFLLIFRGRFAEADQHIARLLQIDPYSVATPNNVAVMRGLEGRFAEARTVAQQMAERNPQMVQPWRIVGGTYIEESLPDLAFDAWKKVKPPVPSLPLIRAMAVAKAGHRAQALALLAPFEDKYASNGTAMWMAFVYAFLGDDANTVKWLTRSADLHEWAALSMGVHPVFAKTRNSPEFIALRQRMGLLR